MGYRDPKQSTRRKILGRVAPVESFERVHEMERDPLSDLEELYESSESFQTIADSWPRLDRETRERIREIVRKADTGKQ